MKAIVVGATSGIGRALAGVLSEHGWEVGGTGRNEEALAALQGELRGPVPVRRMDVTRPVEAMAAMRALIAEMGGVDLVVISSGVGHVNPDLAWPPEEETIAVNVTGFTAIANVAMHHFEERGAGHLVGISSLSGLRGSRWAPAYGASKAFVSNYLEGLRFRARHAGLPIAVTDVLPGFVDTPMTAGQERMFWVAPVRKAAEQIYQAIRRRRSRAYITRRWALVAWVMRHLPDRVLERV